MKVPKLNRFRIALGAGILLAIVVIGGLGWGFVQQLSLAEELRGETRELEQALATQKAHQRHLTATLTYVHTDAYVEEWAREEAKMAKPGEVVVIPLVRGNQSQPTESREDAPELQPASEDETRPFWHTWWLALLGSE